MLQTTMKTGGVSPKLSGVTWQVRTQDPEGAEAPPEWNYGPWNVLGQAG
jgi:hypothetical protein